MPDTLNGVILRLVGFAFFAYCAYLAAKDSKRSAWYHLRWCVGLGLIVFVFSMTPSDNYSGGDGLTDPGEYVDTTEASPPRQAAINALWSALGCAAGVAFNEYKRWRWRRFQRAWLANLDQEQREKESA